MIIRNRLPLLFALLLLYLMSACSQGGASPPPGETLPATSSATSDVLTIWTTFNDQNPQNDQGQWLADTLTASQKEGLAVVNHYHDYAQINSKLNLAVQSGGDIPDLSYVNSQHLSTYIQQGTLEDISSFVRNAPWFRDLTPEALKACTGPDGKIYCVPGHIYSRLLLYWKDAWPEGIPGDTDSFLAVAATLKQKDQFAITFKGSEAAAAEGFYFSLIQSFGGTYADANGHAAWASPETAAAVAFIRTLIQKQYAPDVVLAPGFDFERPFTDGKAASIAAGSWSVVYLSPLRSPTGKGFDKGSSSVAAAVDAGELGLAPYVAAPGHDPVVLLTMPAWALPKGSKHPDLAMRFLNYLMDTKRNADYALASGGIPVLTSAASDPRFKTDYWTFVQQQQQRYGRQMEPLVNYDQAITTLSETISRLALDPELDILAELKTAQDNYNLQQAE